MKKIENRTPTERRDYLRQLILKSVATAGVLGIALVAPNVLKSMHKLGIISGPRQREYIASSASRMTKRGLLKFNGKHYELTTSGEKLLRKWELADYRIKKPQTWDGKWRMVIFDIPEKRRRVRKQITSIFTQASFYRLQDSVWVYPYDCEEIIALLKTELGAGKDILYIVAEEIENDKHLRREFNL